MRCSPGAIAAGSFPVTRTLPKRRGVCSICTPGAGKAPLGPAPGRPMRVEHEYFRAGALTYLAAWDVHRAKLFGRCEPKARWGLSKFTRADLAALLAKLKAQELARVA